MDNNPDTKTHEVQLTFDNTWVEARLIENPRNVDVGPRTIVVNLSTHPLMIPGESAGFLRPWRSTTIQGLSVSGKDRLACLRILEERNIGHLSRTWTWYGDVDAGFPKETPLFVSPEHEVGQVKTTAQAFTGVSAATPLQTFRLVLRAWFVPGNTDCVIHTGHTFLETHTQIYGEGRMQKFRAREENTLYEDVAMIPGLTHEPFAVVKADGEWKYPWHRYLSVSDCIWMALELHPNTEK